MDDDDPADWAKMIDDGVDAIISDDPAAIDCVSEVGRGCVEQIAGGRDLINCRDSAACHAVS